MPYVHFFNEKIFFCAGLFFSRLEQPKRPPKPPGFASVAAALIQLSTWDPAADLKVLGSAGVLVLFGARTPPTRRAHASQGGAVSANSN